jgi:hypothetical protein
MSVITPILSVGFDKNNEAEFGVHLSNLIALSYEDMQRIRAMIPVAIAEFERMWADHSFPERGSGGRGPKGHLGPSQGADDNCPHTTKE